MKEKYDYVIIGAGIFACVFAYEAAKRGASVLVVEKREHIGGNVYCKDIEGIAVHYYGPHIFHTNNKKTWDYVNSITTFTPFVNSPLAICDDVLDDTSKIYNLPFNMNTFYQLWGVVKPEQAKRVIQEQRVHFERIENAQQQALSVVGKDIYELFIKGYTQKQWGRPCSDLPSEILKRIPVRFTYNNNYFDDDYQGIPEGGYNSFFETLLDHDNIDLLLNTDYFKHKQSLDAIAKKTVYTGELDRYFNYSHGRLGYRSLRFDHEVLDTDNYQGNAVVNYTNENIAYTRIVEHKHFSKRMCINQNKTVITKEYPQAYTNDNEPYYPINDDKNNKTYAMYASMADKQKNFLYGGRLADFAYYNMDQVVEKALELVQKEIG